MGNKSIVIFIAEVDGVSYMNLKRKVQLMVENSFQDSLLSINNNT